MSDTRLHLVAGAAEHGVVRFGLDLAAAMGDRVVHLDAPSLPSRWAPDGPLPDTIQLHWTDGLYGPDTHSAASVFVRLCHNLRAATGGRLTATLHDLPDPADQPDRYRRRSQSYRRILSAVDGATVASHHELLRLNALLGSAADLEVPVAVIPLPISQPVIPSRDERPEPSRETAVFGFVYPGKGHDTVLEAMSRLPQDIGFAVLGRTAYGHADLAARLQEVSEQQGRPLRIDGYIPEGRLLDRLRQVAVPIVPGAAVSASGSLNTWIWAGRRPLVAEGPYACELEQHYPGGVRLYRPGGLPGMIDAALADPGLTWLGEPPPAQLLFPAVAQAHATLASLDHGLQRIS